MAAAVGVRESGLMRYVLLLLLALPLTVLGQEPAEDDKPKWDVNEPPGPRREIAIRTTSGTWMSLDVSPDGREIVFDLLGDLYALPIEGGQARSLTSGMAWDMQPRYSPDGERIAFTSDRGGGDNLWIVDRDGSNPVEVTKEKFRLLNSPVWSPDGDFLAARKHFTSRRSLGAGEIWLYHRSGGEGLQMTERPNDQKDLGEPAFSPDGRYLYFSRDATSGSTFEYSKDPNTQIYVIERLDRETGDIEKYVTGPGGSIRPTPSPDGKSLAFIRRVRYRTTLFVKNLVSGRETPLYDGLDRDMQETWAVHGVYPTMAWTPDSASIVFWARGGIQRIDVASKTVTAIPFEVDSTREILEAVRFKVEAAPDTLHPKMLRWVRVSPDGERVVYQALGRLWLRDLPDGEPRRLTAQTDHFEHYPSFSRDGRSIVYTTWDDEALGSIRIASVADGESRVVTPTPGHYLEPVFSPSGETIVFRKAGGGFLRSPLYSADPGLYRIARSGGEMRRIRRKGAAPFFGASEERVYFLESEKEKQVLRSVKLDGGDERTHFESEDATSFALSPDEKWIAFTELFNAYVAPFVATGRSQTLGAKAKSIPIAKVSADAGEYLHFSGDSRRLHWALGPKLFTRELTDAFAFLEGSPEELPEEAVEGVDISFDVPAAGKTAGIIALTGARLVTMNGDEIIADGVIVVEGNRIQAVGRRSDVSIPDAATVIDVAGKTILPGLVDVHHHGPYGTQEIIPQRNWAHDATLAFGVTTTHNPSADTSTVFAASEMARAGVIVAPRLFSTGTILYGAKAPIRAEVDSLEAAEAHIRRMKAVGAFSVKSYNQPRRDQRQQVIEAAREQGVMVVPEGGSLYHHNMTMVVDGHTGIEHSVPVERLYGDAIALWSESGTGYTPTLVVAYGGLWGENYWYQHDKVWENERLLEFVPRFVVDPRSRRRTMVPEEEFNHISIARGAAQLVHAGGRVQLGAHGQMQGLAPHWELWMFVQGGMTEHEALRAATLDGARYLGLDGDLGSLEAGKLADLIVLDGDPLTDIRQSENVRYTMINGRLYEAATMDEVAPGSARRPAPFWRR